MKIHPILGIIERFIEDLDARKSKEDGPFNVKAILSALSAEDIHHA